MQAKEYKRSRSVYRRFLLHNTSLSSQRPVPGRDRSAVNFSNSSSKAHARPHGCGGGCGVTSLTVSLLCYGPLARYRHRHPSGLLGTREDSFLEYTHTVASSERRRLPVEFALSIVRRLGDLRHLVGRYPNVKHRVWVGWPASSSSFTFCSHQWSCEKLENLPQTKMVFRGADKELIKIYLLRDYRPMKLMYND